jgi:hypothetical protein
MDIKKRRISNDFKFVEVVLNKCSISEHLYVNFKIFCYNIFNNLATVPQSLQYHKLPPPSVLRPACYQPGQATWRVASQVYV